MPEYFHWSERDKSLYVAWIVRPNSKKLFASFRVFPERDQTWRVEYTPFEGGKSATLITGLESAAAAKKWAETLWRMGGADGLWVRVRRGRK